METEKNAVLVKKLVSGSWQGLIGSIGGRFIGVISIVFIARVLGPAYFGLFSIGWTLINFISLIATGGMDRVVLRFAPRFLKQDSSALRGLLFRAIGMSIVFGLSLGILLFFLSPWLANVVYRKPDLESVFHLFAVDFPAIIILIVVAASTRINQEIKYSVMLQDIGQTLLGLVLMVGFYLLGLKLFGMILADIISNIIAVLIGFTILVRLFPEIFVVKTISKISFKEMFGFSIPAVLGGAFSVYVFWIDRILVGYFRTSFENGIYQSVSQLSTIFLVISAGINAIVVPMFAHYHQNGDTKSLQEVYKISTKWAIYISIPILALLILSPRDVLSFIYGFQYGGGANVLIILLIGQIINLFTGSVNPLLVMTGNQSFLFKISGIVLCFDIVMNILLIPSIGLIGAAICTSLSLGILYLVALFWVKQKLDLWPFDRRYYKGLISGLLAFLGIYLTKFIFPGIQGFGVILEGSIAVIVFSISLLIQKLDYEDLEFLTMIKKSFSKTI
jgi:O-antigen/teichoic acid export membrane protein